MTDFAFELLQQRINGEHNSVQQCLWVVDENISATQIARVSPSVNLQVLSNRCDIYSMLKARGFNSVISDFDFSLLTCQRFDRIFFRVSKEKAIVHHIINCAAQYLKDGGALVISGYKNEGIKTYISKAGDYLGDGVDIVRGEKTAFLASLNYQTQQHRAPLDDKDYLTLRVINPDDSTPFISKPGLFGWNKIDQGSAFLVEHLSLFFQKRCFQKKSSAPACIMDLGCGYGYLSVMASRLIDAEFIATDNNITAVRACQENFKQHAINGAVVLADCADVVQRSADVVICNPPFHQGFAIEGDLTLKFLLSCKRILVPGGRALFVVNSFIPLERKGSGIFSAVNVISNNKRFKLVELIK